MPIKIKDLSYRYDPEFKPNDYAFRDINLTINDGEFIGLIGHTGSGKSTLVQTLNGLIEPSDGEIIINGQAIKDADNLQELRKKIGLVFQYPEHQLFEETVFGDIAFGPRNLALAEEEVKNRVKKAMKMVNLDYESFKDRSPFKLSGGQQRRVAIAGVLAMEPQVLILDEPTASLDPKTRQEIINQIVILQREFSLTIILISHRMEEIAQLSDRIFVLDEGKLVLKGTPVDVFAQSDFLEKIGLGVPQVTKVLNELKKRGNDIKTDLFDIEEAKEEILKLVSNSNDK